MQWWHDLRARVRATDARTKDLLLAGAFFVEAQAELVLLVGDAPNAPVASVALTALATGVALRRRAPLAGVLVAMLAFTTLLGLGREIADNLYSCFFALLLCLYSGGRHADGWRVLLAGAIAWALSIVGTAIDSYPDTPVDFLLGSAVLGIGPLLLGRVIRNRSQLNRTLSEQAERLRRERAAQAEQAAADERTRVAGELHDVVAHAMSAMVVQAAGARRLVAKDPERARDAFGAVEVTGREALTEIRRLLGVLRRDDDEIAFAPQPSLRHLALLVGRVQASGLPVELAVEGDERPLPAGVDLTAYRVVQSALGGAIEQGAAGSARVTVRYRPDAVDVEVTDDGDGDSARRLVGVPERVSLYGGQLQSGRRTGGGHTVSARLPVGAAS